MTAAGRTTYAIGDIHGCPGLLRALLGKVSADSAALGEGRPRVVLLGDYIDRGRGGREVVDLLLSDGFRSAFDAVTLMGNHERMLLDAGNSWDDAQRWLENGGADTVEGYGVEFGRDGTERVIQRFYKALPASHLRFFEGLPLTHREEGYLYVHAGVRPGVPLDRQAPTDLLWIRGEFLRHRGDHGAIVVHGHSPTPSGVVEAHPNRIAVDTGCGFPGRPLSAAAIGPGGSVRVLSVAPPPR